MNNLFNEKQRFTQPWIYFILVGMAFLPLYGMYQQFIVGKTLWKQSNVKLGIDLVFSWDVPLRCFAFIYKASNSHNQSRNPSAFFPFCQKKYFLD